jgi:hypothetical protein
MKTILIASLLTAGRAAPVFAAASTSTQHFAVKDTVGNCAVVDAQPSKVDGLKILGNKGGYSSIDDAKKALGSGCKSVIDRF